MNEILIKIEQFLTSDMASAAVRSAVVVVLGLVLGRVLRAAVGRLLRRRGSMQQAMMAERLTWYTVVGLTFVGAMREMGFDLSVLLGAAGILTVAIGFASQTSASNLISGLFLIGERPFVVGDVIRVGQTTGEVLSIDLMSVKLRTFDNLYVRVPNESLVKSEITNLTHFPIRRVDLHLQVAYKESLSRVRDVLVAVADANPLCLEEPRPLFIVEGFGESSQNVQFSVWARRETYLDVKNQIQQGIKEAFDAEGIEIPYPHRTLLVRQDQQNQQEPPEPEAQSSSSVKRASSS